ncbi:hypothetical protein D2E42_23995 [Mycobacteroides abscessus]|uniref:hypothetical protein n=1 Tax=Mycobacteroides abscessus TaxID=36809 RepID=UPI000D3ED689|nr:hypothetical protein [Mycobacteroides abscessus]PVB47833.1 hypothetical protein DDK10_24020 [Mycobacteroides abscessus]RIR66532.1 hypothetical protein D2E42_23995 [Mycobacteroides abscessus]
MSEWTPEQVADIRNALAIIGDAVLDGNDVVHRQQRLDRYLTNLDSAVRTASGAVKVSGLLLEYIRQLQQQHQDIVAAVIKHYDPHQRNHPAEVLAPKSPAEVLGFVESRLPRE